MELIAGLSWRWWLAVALVYGTIVFFVRGGGVLPSPGNIGEYNVLGYALVALLLLLPLAVVYILRSKANLRLALAVTLPLELLFFFLVPVIPLTNSGTQECSANEGFCMNWMTYGSVAYAYSCAGASIRVRTSITTPSEMMLGNRTITFAHFNGTLPSWVPHR